MKRCGACGMFFDSEECPGDHSHMEDYVPPTPIFPEFTTLRGLVVRFPWPQGGSPTVGVVLGEPDEDGTVGIHILNEHVRVTKDDIEEL